MAATLAVAALFAPVAGAQVFLDAEDRRLELLPGQATSTQITITNPANKSYVVQGAASGNLSDATELEPRRFQLPARSSANVTLTLQPPFDPDFQQGDVVIRFSLIDEETGTLTDQRLRLAMTMNEPVRYLGLTENPLPAPYDTDGWLFALELATWALLAGIIVLATLTFVKVVAPRASLEVQEEMAGKVKWPLFFIPAVLGLNHSWRLLPETPMNDLVSNFLDAFSVLAVAAIGYRLLSAGLFYYGQNVAGRTDTQVDDVLVPVLEKLGAAIIVAAAGFYTLRALGVDFSFLLAGGLVAGLVISMAAQDTLSNFFSGLHILIDRPFREGDVIQLESGEICRVEEIGLRSTNLYHFQKHQEIIAPNNEVAQKRIVNMSYPDRHYRLSLAVGVAYDTDLEEATKILHNVAMETERVLKGRTTAPRVFVKEFGESAIQLELRAYVTDERDRNPATTKLIQRIHAAFHEAGIEIPFPRRVVYMRGDGSTDPPRAEIETPGSEETA